MTRRYRWEDGPLDDDIEEARFRDDQERIDAAIYADEVLRPRYEAARLGKPYAPDDAMDRRSDFLRREEAQRAEEGL